MMEDTQLIRFFEGKTSEEETKRVIAWLDEDKSHVKQYHRLCRLYEVSLMSTKEQSPEGRRSQRLISWKNSGVELLKIASIIIISVLVTKTILTQQADNEPVLTQTVTAPAGQHTEILLADGSKVWLNAGSRLVFPTRFDKEQREVSLNGEGFFDVHANPEKPFIVNAGNYRVRAVGTSFNVRAYSESTLFETSLLKGKVQISDKRSPDLIAELNPNECLTATDGKWVRSTIQNLDYFNWRKGILCFDESLSEVLRQLEQYYDVRIDIARNAQIPLSDHCVAKFRTQDGLEHIFKVLQISHQFRYKIDSENNQITIY